MKHPFYKILITIVLFASLFILIAALLSKKEVDTYQASGMEDKQESLSQQTLWSVMDQEGKKVKSLSNDHPDVIAVKKLVEGHGKVVDNRDYQSINTKDEYAFYVTPFVDELKKGYEEKLYEMYKGNKINLIQTSFSWYEMTFSSEYETARVVVESELEITEASQDYLNENQLKLHTPYQQQRTMDLLKEGDTWKISSINKTPFIKKDRE